MSRRRKKKKKKKRTTAFDSGTQARRLARAVLGLPPGERVQSSKKKQKPKHKRREWERELEE